MAKQIKVIIIQQNQLLEIPSENIEIEAKSNEEPPIIIAILQKIKYCL